MTQKEKYEQLDKELRPKYAHLSDHEYWKVRTRYINSQLAKIRLKFFFRGILIPWGVGILLMGLLPIVWEGESKLRSFVMVLLTSGCAIWMGVEFLRRNADRAKLPAMDSCLLTSKRISRDLGRYGLPVSLVWIILGFLIMFAAKDDSFTRFWVIAAPVLLLLGIGVDLYRRWMWKTGKYRLVARRAVTKELDTGSIEVDDAYWLYFDGRGSENLKCRVSETEYNDMKTGDRYYLVLKKKFNGKDKVLKFYKAELITLDDDVKAILQE